MSLQTWLIYLATGRMFVWLLQSSGLIRPLWKRSDILAELGQCDLCLGVWVYSLLALSLPQPFRIYPKVLEILSLAALTSLAGHLLRLGWERKFGVTIIDD